MDPNADTLTVSIRSYHKDNLCVVIVEDNGSGFKPAHDTGSGIKKTDDSESYSALTNILQRLKMMCDGKLEIAPGDGGGTVVTVTIPDRRP